MRQFFICNQEDVHSKLLKLTKTGTSDDGWTEFYLDETLSEEWRLTRFNSEYHGGGIPVLKKIPEPTIEQLIDIAMTSTDKNNIIGASLELSERERHNKEDFRSKLIERLLTIDTSKLTDFEKERLKIIVYESGLYDATNRRNIVGKHFTEIQNDADYYRTISEQAKNILNNI
jgi:hypothetical protein